MSFINPAAYLFAYYYCSFSHQVFTGHLLYTEPLLWDKKNNASNSLVVVVSYPKHYYCQEKQGEEEDD